MIRLKNLTPFAFGYRLTSRKPPQRELTVVVRGKFRLAPGEPMCPAKAELTRIDLADELVPERARAALERAALVVGQGTVAADVFAEDDAMMLGALSCPSDLADFKLNAEWLVKAHCHTPNATPMSECEVGVEIGHHKKSLHVVGPRVWVDRFLGGKATEPLPFTSMPIDWAHAYGGPDFPDNPVGKGHPLTTPLEKRADVEDLPRAIQLALTKHEELPNVEDPRHRISRQGHHPPPAGFGPLSPWWPQRRSRLGSEYGDDYQAKYAPFHPRDFDWRYFHAAPEDQQLDGYLRGDEPLRFSNLHPAVSDFRTQLPGLRVRAFVLRSGVGVEVPLALDTVYADLCAGELTLTWRGLVAVSEDDYSDVPLALIASEALAEPARPAADYLAELDRFAADPVGLNEGKLPRLQKLQDDLDSGKLAQDIDALPEDEKLMAAIAARVGEGLVPVEQLALLSEGTSKAGAEVLKNNPSAGRELKKAVLLQLENGQDLPAPQVATDKEGRQTIAPALRGVMGGLAAEQKAIPEVDWSDMNEALDDAVAGLADPGVKGDTLTMKSIAERPLVEPAPGADLSWQDLSDRDLSELDLTGANFEGATLSRCKLVRARLDGANFRGAGLSRADLSGAQGREADFTGAILSRTNFSAADLGKASLERAFLLKANLANAKLDAVRADSCQVQQADFTGASLEGASFEFCIFDRCDFRDAVLVRGNFKRSLFRECKLQRARLDGADVSKAGFIQCDLSDARLWQLFGVGTNWMKSVLVRADFSHAVLAENIFQTVDAVGANLYAADMPRARFYKAGLREVRLDFANLLGADMRKAVLTDCSFQHANLYDAKLFEAVGTDVDLRHANMKSALVDRARLVTR